MNRLKNCLFKRQRRQLPTGFWCL